VKAAGIKIVPVSKINTDASNDSVSHINFKDCNCVAFRLDDIQDFYLTVAQREVIEIFKSFQIPITAGVIGNSFGQDPSIVDYVRGVMENVANNPRQCFQFEIANHGYRHEDFSTFTLDQQNTLLSNANAKISTQLGVVPKTFIPPFNIFDANTVTAAQTQGFTYFSSQVELDRGPYNFENPTLWHFPMGASTSVYESGLTSYIGVPAQRTWQQIQTQLQRDGFSTVMMHPGEFSNHNSDGTISNTLNQTMLTELRNLLTTVKASGIRMVLINRVKDYFTLTNDPCASSPSSSSVGSSTSSSVGSTTITPTTTRSTNNPTSSTSGSIDTTPETTPVQKDETNAASTHSRALVIYVLVMAALVFV